MYQEWDLNPQTVRNRGLSSARLPFRHLGIVAIPGIEPGPQGYEPSELAVTPYRHLEQKPRFELEFPSYQDGVIADYTTTAYILYFWSDSNRHGHSCPRDFKSLACCQFRHRSVLYLERDSNSHAFRHQILNLACATNFTTKV